MKKNILGLCCCFPKALRNFLKLATPTPIIQFFSNYAYYQYFLQALTPAPTFTLKLLVSGCFKLDFRNVTSGWTIHFGLRVPFSKWTAWMVFVVASYIDSLLHAVFTILKRDQGPIVQKLINANPGWIVSFLKLLKVNQTSNERREMKYIIFDNFKNSHMLSCSRRKLVPCDAWYVPHTGSTQQAHNSARAITGSKAFSLDLDMT